jgi:hypothetical protein
VIPSIVTFVVAVFLATALAFRNPRAALLLLAFLLPATGLYIDVGVSLSAAKVVALGLLFWAVANLRTLRVAAADKGMVLALLVYAVSITCILGLYTMMDETINVDSRVRWRWAVQSGTLVLGVLPYFLAITLIRTRAEVILWIDALIAGVIVLCAIGLAQWTLREFLDVRVLGIARDGIHGEWEDAFFVIAGEQFNRINSLAREPKDLAVAIAVALPLVLWRYRGFKRIALALVSMLSLLLTYSTTGVVILFVAMVIFLFKAIVDARIRIPLPLRHVILLVLGIAVIGLALTTDVKETPDFGHTIAREVIEDRVLSRLQEPLEEYDALTLEFLSKQPIWTLSGVGAGMLPRFANAYLPTDPVLLAYMDNHTWDAKAGFLRSLGSFGLIGLALGLASFLLILRALKESADSAPGERAPAFLFTYIVFLISAHMLRGIDDLLWVLIGAGAAWTLHGKMQCAPGMDKQLGNA